MAHLQSQLKGGYYPFPPEHLPACVDIAVFRDWYPDLLRLGQREKLVRPLTGDGHPVHAVSLDRSRWTTLISASVESRELGWPESSAA
jgi:hypothetical protein